MKITVAIPTIAGRSTYLKSAIATCTADPDADLEILVSDNSAGANEAMVRGIGDSRIRYIRPPGFLPMASHWEFMLDHVSGEAVTIIGDDDGLMPGAIAALRKIHGEVGNVPVHHPLANYGWPDHPDPQQRNQVQFIHPPIARSGWQSASGFLGDVASGRSVYLEGPMIYHNFLPMPLIRKIAGQGRFFRRPIPDVYSALAVAANIERFYTSRTMLTLAGQGARSNGALVNVGESDGTTFAIPADPALRPRFRSRGVAMITLDAFLEVERQWPQALAGIPLDKVRFFSDALSQARQMPSNKARGREAADILQAALGHGEALGLALVVARRAARKLAGTGSAKEPASVHQTLAMGPEVRDIESATRALSAQLEGGLSAVAGSA